MKVLIRVKRTTEYASIVEMPEEKFKRISKAIEHGGERGQAAELEANKLIDVRDWQDDELASMEEFVPYLETKPPVAAPLS